MTPDKVDLTSASFVVLVKPPEHPVVVDQEQLRNILSPPLMVAQSVDGQFLVSSQRDQIQVTVAGNRIVVSDLAGRPRFGDSKLPSALWGVLQFVPSKVTAYGINFDFTVETPNSSTWIMDRLLKKEFVGEQGGKSLLGGSVKLTIQERAKRWHIQLEERDKNRLRVDFNSHEETDVLPDPNQLLKEQQEQYELLMLFLTRLGL